MGGKGSSSTAASKRLDIPMPLSSNYGVNVPYIGEVYMDEPQPETRRKSKAARQKYMRIHGIKVPPLPYLIHLG